MIKHQFQPKGLRFILFFSFLFLLSCQRDNILQQEQWGDIFKAEGIDSACFELADNTHDQVFLYNLERCSRRMSPASTYKIMNSLMALETSVVPDEQFVLPWDGVQRRPEWDTAMNLKQAFAVSNVPFFQELARRLGTVESQKWLDTVRYGNKRIGPKVDEYWLNDTLQITPDEQVGFVKKLYFDKLPFSQRTQRIVRNIMLREDSTDYRLYYKTGTWLPQRSGKAEIMCWLVGFVERREEMKGVVTKQKETHYRPYFFAMNFSLRDTTIDNQALRVKILKSILRERQILH